MKIYFSKQYAPLLKVTIAAVRFGVAIDDGKFALNLDYQVQ